MERLTLNQLKNLAQQMANPSISIFLPTHRNGQDTQQDPTRFKNLLREAEKQLLCSGTGPREVSGLLKPAEALIEDSNFWNHQHDGLAVFLAPDDFHYFRLPLSVEELLIISQSYYLKPVLPMFTNNGHYFILALSQNEIRLFEGTHYYVSQIDLPEGTPENLEATLRLDDPQKQLQMHSAQRRTAQGISHGQGHGEDDQKVLIEQYFKMVDTSLKDIFREQQAPLILAGVDYLLPIYKITSEYAHIMQAGIIGSPEHMKPEELHKQAWPIVEAHFHQQTVKALEQYQQLASTEKAIDNFDEIVRAAFIGRVDKLIISDEAQVWWGVFNQQTGQVTHCSEQQSILHNLALLDFAAMQTLQNSGVVFSLSQIQMPTDSPIAAVLRY